MYDFGNDWIFVVTLKKILDKKSEHPVCVGYKSSLNAIEDDAYPFMYEELRYALENWDKYTNKQKKEAAEKMNYDKTEYFIEVLEDRKFDLEYVNKELQEM